MTINKTNEGGAAVLALEGRLDTVTAPQLETEVKGLDDSVKELVFDFQNLEYISSAGLRVLLSAQKSMTAKGGSMKVIHVSSVVMEVFEVTGFSDILTIE